MKQCPLCHQSFSDENSFCLSDGTPLSYLSERPEDVTVVRASPLVQQSEQLVRKGVSPIFAYLFAGLLVLVIVGVVILALKSFLLDPSINTTLSSSKKESYTPNPQKVNLQDQQTALDEEKKKLADERKKLEELKNKPVDLPTITNKQPVSRITFRRGSVEETITGVVVSERSFLLRTKSGQFLLASLSSGNGCVVFGNGSTSMSYTTSRGDNSLELVNNCGDQANFNLTVYVR